MDAVLDSPLGLTSKAFLGMPGHQPTLVLLVHRLQPDQGKGDPTESGMNQPQGGFSNMVRSRLRARCNRTLEAETEMPRASAIWE